MKKNEAQILLLLSITALQLEAASYNVYEAFGDSVTVVAPQPVINLNVQDLYYDKRWFGDMSTIVIGKTIESVPWILKYNSTGAIVANRPAIAGVIIPEKIRALWKNDKFYMATLNGDPAGDGPIFSPTLTRYNYSLDAEVHVSMALPNGITGRLNCVAQDSNETTYGGGVIIDGDVQQYCIFQWNTESNINAVNKIYKSRLGGYYNLASRSIQQLLMFNINNTLQGVAIDAENRLILFELTTLGNDLDIQTWYESELDNPTYKYYGLCKYDASSFFVTFFNGKSLCVVYFSCRIENNALQLQLSDPCVLDFPRFYRVDNSSFDLSYILNFENQQLLIGGTSRSLTNSFVRNPVVMRCDITDPADIKHTGYWTDKQIGFTADRLVMAFTSYDPHSLLIGKDIRLYHKRGSIFIEPPYDTLSSVVNHPLLARSPLPFIG